MNKTKTRKELESNPNFIVPIAFDDIFKVVFGSEENADITAYLVSLLLKIPYEKVKGKIVFKDSKNYKYRTKEKKSEKDIVFLVDTSVPMKINLEMNFRDTLESEIIDRNVYYLSNLFGSGLITSITLASKLLLLIVPISSPRAKLNPFFTAFFVAFQPFCNNFGA